LLLELAPSAVERRLILLERARRELEQLLPHRLPALADERQHSLPVDRDDRDRPGMLDDLTLVLAPALQRDAHELPLVDDACLVGLHAPNRFMPGRASASRS